MRSIKKDAPLMSRDGETNGSATGGGYHCQQDGCRGWRIGVRWNDGTITFPCSKGMRLYGPGATVEGGRIL